MVEITEDNVPTNEKEKAEKFIQERVKQVMGAMELFGIDADRFTEYSADVLSEVFRFGDMGYFAGIKLFNRVIDRLGINMDQQRWYEVFGRIYAEDMQEKKDELGRSSR